MERREGIYKRKTKTLDFDPFTPNMRHSFDVAEEKVFESIRNYQINNLSSKHFPETR